MSKKIRLPARPPATPKVRRGPLSICFDLDGTIIDTAPDLVRVLNIVIGKAGLAETDYAAARAQIGFGSRAMIVNAYRRVGRTIETDALDAMQSEFLNLYADDIAQKSQPFDGVETTLRGLLRAGHSLSVCTNKPGYLARPLITALNMDRYFDRVIGGDDLVRNKPYADHIFMAAGHTDRSSIVMVGDGAPDTLSAINANVPCLVMNYGYSTVPFYQLGGTQILRDFKQLPSALRAVRR